MKLGLSIRIPNKACLKKSYPIRLGLYIAKGAPYGNQNAKKDGLKDEKPANQEIKKNFMKMPIGKVEKWLVDEAKKAGLDIEGFEHEITNHFVNHVMKEHGNEKNEKNRGQIAIKQEDVEKIPWIVKTPDIAIIGAKRGDDNIIIYAKEMKDGTTIYLEEVLSGRNNKTLRGKTMYKRKGAIDEENLKSIVTMNEKTDISEAKIVIGGGGHSPGGAVKPSSPAVATSAHPADTLNISQSGKKSSIKETTDTIKAVNAQYGYAPEFVDFRKQVGAAIASISLLSGKPLKKSSLNLGEM